MKRLLFLLLSLPIFASGQTQYTTVGFASEIWTNPADEQNGLVLLINDLKPQHTGGIFFICDTCASPDSITRFGRAFNSRIWKKVAEIPAPTVPTGKTGQVLHSDGAALGYANVSSLISSFVLSYANGVLTGTITPISGSPISDTANIPNTATGLPTTLTKSTPTRSLGTTGWTPHVSKGSLVYYTVTCTSTNPLLAGTSSSNFVLEYYNGSTWLPIQNTGNSNGVTLAVAVALTNGQTGVLSAYVNAGEQIRIQVTNTGTATGSLVRSLEYN